MSTISPNFTDKETEDREVKKSAPGHTASKLKRQELTLGSQAPGLMFCLLLAPVIADFSPHSLRLVLALPFNGLSTVHQLSLFKLESISSLGSKKYCFRPTVIEPMTVQPMDTEGQLYIYWKKLCIQVSGSSQFKPVFLKGQL